MAGTYLKAQAKKILTGHCLKEYQEALRKTHVIYNDWIKDAEQQHPYPGAFPAMKVIPYSRIAELRMGVYADPIEDQDLLVFLADGASLSANAAEYLHRAYDNHPELSLFYGDEDEQEADGSLVRPYFKPDWSPDSYLSAFYIGSIFAVRAPLLKSILAAGSLADTREPGMTGTMSSADRLFGLLARSANGFEKRDGLIFPICHIPAVLAHRPAGADLFQGRPFAQKPENQPLIPHAAVSIIIPSKDHPEILLRCLTSILDHAFAAEIPAEEEGRKRDIAVEILIIDNGSSGYNRLLIEKGIRALLARKHPQIFSIDYDWDPYPFNFSKMCNLGAAKARGNFLLFLNDDIEIATDGWLSDLIDQAEKPYAGAVGMKLLYPDSDLIQHIGVTNVRRGPMHKLQKISDAEPMYFGINRGTHDMIAVTGACLMMKRERFREIGGFREELAVAFNDVDLCYSLLELGYYNICCNDRFLYHHESLSRGDDNQDPEKIRRLTNEYKVLMAKHEELYHIDPFYHRHLTDDEHEAEFERLIDADPSLAGLPFAEVKRLQEPLPESLEDPCLRVGVEYSSTIRTWIRNYQLAGTEAPEDGYYIHGYSFVIGSDNAIFERQILLRHATGTVEQPVPVPGSEVYTARVTDRYRRDIRKNAPDLVHVELSGFGVKIREHALPEGMYQVGMVVRDRTSRNRIVSWESISLTIGKDPYENN